MVPPSSKLLEMRCMLSDDCFCQQVHLLEATQAQDGSAQTASQLQRQEQAAMPIARGAQASILQIHAPAQVPQILKDSAQAIHVILAVQAVLLDLHTALMLSSNTAAAVIISQAAKTLLNCHFVPLAACQLPSMQS